jgi:diguanylate cyclase (GGDEF)-like protein
VEGAAVGVRTGEHDVVGADEVLDALGCAVAVLDASGTIASVNAAWRANAAQWGDVGDHYLAAHRSRAEHTDIDVLLQEGVQRAVSGKAPRFNQEYPVVDPATGSMSWHLLVATPLAGRPGWGVLAHVDVTQHHDVREILDARANRDALTGLPNRRAIAERLATAVVRSRRDGTPVSVVFIDLDGFKTVNDGLGHEVGDEVLVAVGRRLSRTVRANDALGRWGGDEFIVVMDGGTEAASALAKRLHAAMDEPVALSRSRSVDVRLSVGGAQARPALVGDDVVARADMAMFRAKRSGELLVYDGPAGATDPHGGDR